MNNNYPRLPRPILYCALASSLLLIVVYVYGARYYGDAQSYIDAWDLSFSQGRIDILRTPVYPLFLAVVRAIVGVQYFRFAAICIQHLVFLCSLSYFYRLAVGMLSSTKLALGLTIFYALSPVVTIWHNAIMTESFALSGLVFLVYLIYQMYIGEWSKAMAWCYGGLLLFLLLLRPAFVYLLPVLGLSWLIALCNPTRRKAACVGLSFTVITTMCLLGYIKSFEHEHGVFATSSVSTINQCVNGINYGIIDYGDENGYFKTLERIQTLGLKYVHDELTESYRAQPLLWAKKTVVRSYQASMYPVFVTRFPFLDTITDLFGPRLAMINLFLLLYAIICVLWAIVHRSFPWLSASIYMLVASHYIVSLVGSFGDYGRLILPTIPLYLLMAGQLCAFFGGRTTLSETLK